MKLVSASGVAALLALAGCGGVPTGTQESLEDKFTKLEVQMTQKLDKAHAVYSIITDDMMKLSQRVSKLESDLQLLTIDLKKLGERLDQLGAGAPPREGAAPGVDRAEVGMKIDQALAKLKASGKVDEAARELIPIARYSVPRMTEALRETAPEYVESVEKVLAKCPVNELKGPLEDALKDRRRRTSVARVVGSIGDRDLSKILEAYSGDSDPIVQVEIGEAFLACKNRAGVPPLLKALGAPEPEIRFRAILSLKRLNKGETYGFDMNKSSEDNAAAIKSWHDWWQREGTKLFE